MSSHHTPEEIRKGLTHPVIDGDGHWVEYTPVFAERIRKVTGDLGANGFLQSQRRIPDSLNMTLEQRTERGVAMEGFWGRQSTNTRDRATAMMPRMLYDRLGELGIDFGIVYPTAGLGIPRIADDATRRAVIRGFNVVTHDYFKDLSDKLTPAAVIPVHTPDEAIEELEFVTKQLGAKVCMFGSGVRRPIPHAKGAPADLARYAQGFDQLGLDSEYDYDPLWQKCRELGIAPTFHTGGRSYGERNSPSNFTFNHIGHFAAAGHNVAKALFLGGVTRRFPDLRFAFLEGGVGWGCQLFCDLIEHGSGAAPRAWPTWTRPSSIARCCASWSTSTATPISPPSSTSATAGRSKRTSSPAGCRRTTTSTATSRRSRTGSTSTPRRTTSAARPMTG